METKVDYDFFKAMEEGNIFERLYHNKRIGKILESSDFGSKKVLEIGCGTGCLTIPLSKRAKNLTGLDISGWCISKSKKYREEFKTSYKLLIGDIFHLPFKSGSFNIVILADVIEHLPDRHLAIREVRRILSNKGEVVITVPWKYHPVWQFKLKRFFSGRRDIKKEPIHDSFNKRRMKEVFDDFIFKKYSVYCYFSEVIAIFQKS